MSLFRLRYAGKGITQLNGARRQIRQLLQDGVIRGGGGGGHSPVAGSSDFRLCAQQKHTPHVSLHYRGVGQDYWQSLSYLPSGARAGSDKIKANE